MTNQSALVVRMALLLLMLAYGTDAKLEIISKKQEVQVGEEIFLVCKAGGEGEITWRKDGEDIDDEEKVTKLDETTSKFVINKATMQDAGTYTCHCDYDSGHQDDTQIKLYVYEGPSFGSTTTYHEFLEGTDGLVPCRVTGQPSVDVTWLRDGNKIPSDERSRWHQLPDNTLRIEKVKREDAGTYVCEAKIKGMSFKEQLPVSVVVNAPPTVRLREEMKKVLAGPETNVSLMCLMDGVPKPNITWTIPVMFDPSHHQFNSDRSQLTIRSVARDDNGEYICTATNKIAESSATIKLHVFEATEVFVSAEQQSASVGERVSVSCNVTGHPQPDLHWLNKHNGQTLDSTSGRVRVVDGVLVIDEVVPSDGGLYSCMAVSTTGNASRDVAIHTQPGPPHYLSVSAVPTSILFFLKTPPVSGGTPITSFALQWRQSAAEQWKETTVLASDLLAITNLKPYTWYTVRLAALNAVGLGQFSETNTIQTQGIQGKTGDGGTPLQHFSIRYRQLCQDKARTEWKETQLLLFAYSISLQDLSFGSDYQLEVTAVNANGSSISATFTYQCGFQR